MLGQFARVQNEYVRELMELSLTCGPKRFSVYPSMFTACALPTLLAPSSLFHLQETPSVKYMLLPHLNFVHLPPPWISVPRCPHRTPSTHGCS